MVFLKNDYNCLGSKEIMEALLKLSSENNIGYGLDKHTIKAKELIRKEIEDEKADIYFLSGGTITNKIGIAHLLRPYEAVICAESGHINVHETGAVESTGHKILTCKTVDGKIRKEDILSVLGDHEDFHKVLPRAIYISESTEVGTTYSLKELEELYACAKENNLYLFIDGARLSVALNAENITLKDIRRNSDMFYIGGTKNGAPLGEALVITNDNLKKDFAYMLKNQGGLLAKGFLCGIIFEEFFKDGLYYENGAKANLTALEIRKILKKYNIEEVYKNNTNQIFISIKKDLYQKLIEYVACEIFEEKEDALIVRLVTNFNTSLSDLEDFEKALKIIL